MEYEIIFITKNENNKLKIILICCGIIEIIIGITAIYFSVQLMSHTSSAAALFVVSCLFILIGTASTAWGILLFQTYVNVYENHIQGKGIFGLSIRNFYLINDHINNIIKSKKSILIHSLFGKFKVIVDNKNADKLYEYFVTLKLAQKQNSSCSSSLK